MKQLWLIDIDGTICEDIPNETPELFATAKPIDGALDMVLNLKNSGGRITYFTARTTEHAEVTETWLKENGFPFESICYNKPVASSFVPQGIQTINNE